MIFSSAAKKLCDESCATQAVKSKVDIRGKVVDMATSCATQIAERKPPRASLCWTDADTLGNCRSGEWDRIVGASGNETVLHGLVSQLSILGSHGERIDPEATDFALGFVDAMKPRDPAEALLLSQMAATHQAVMMLARRLNHAENIPQQDAAERALNKTARTFVTQMETLKRYRSNGQQVVRVERVTVNDGGQAIVGNAEPGGRAHEKNLTTTPCEAPMPRPVAPQDPSAPERHAAAPLSGAGPSVACTVHAVAHGPVRQTPTGATVDGVAKR